MKKRRINKPPEASFQSKSCNGKKKYASEWEAAYMIDTQREYGRNMDGVHPYRCDFCDKWHLGHKMDD